ncbi:response regulator transcription factor [Corallincola luteus]|uniref:Phosphate regulon transcriptional regulatory protein PhoB n=2 Tax=Corallincola TaxID=1775176 RepID=A0A368NNG1_9GAMM|nr:MULTISPECIES: response regulator transcription factor [Corallincola]RCU50841.1 DNA-binding response regulator [Corallincola holothuriorum]TCI03897.1 response regulator transcription factor [Corallincola luteus]
MKAKILLVEDHADIANLVGINLGMMDYQVDAYPDGRQASRQLHQDYDMAIFDIMLPGGIDGLSLCRQLRRINEDIPILMLTAKSGEQDLVMGLESGADDYLSKPFSVLELQARVKALLRRYHRHHQQQETGPAPILVDELAIDPATRLVHVAEQLVNLTATEFELLWHMASQPGRVFSRDQLLNQVWGHRHDGYAHTVNSTVNRLRSKLELDPAQPKWIHTVWGVGYKFAGEHSC